MLVYYDSNEYEAGKHRILIVIPKFTSENQLESWNKPIVNIPHGAIAIDDEYNLSLCHDLKKYAIEGKYYVDSEGSLCEVEGWKPEFEEVI